MATLDPPTPTIVDLCTNVAEREVEGLYIASGVFLFFLAVIFFGLAYKNRNILLIFPALIFSGGATLIGVMSNGYKETENACIDRLTNRR